MQILISKKEAEVHLKEVLEKYEPFVSQLMGLSCMTDEITKGISGCKEITMLEQVEMEGVLRVMKRNKVKAPILEKPPYVQLSPESTISIELTNVPSECPVWFKNKKKVTVSIMERKE